MLLKIRRNNENEKGISIVELAICLPFLVVLLFGTIDISFGLVNYMVLSQMVREGVRFGGGMPELTDSITFDQGFGNYNTIMQDCETHPSALAEPCGHAVIHQRIRRLYEINVGAVGLDLDPENLDISTTYRRVAADPEDEDTLVVTLNTSFQGMFLGSWPISVTQVGPYLSRSD